MQSLGFQAAGGSNGGCSTSAGVSPRVMDSSSQTTSAGKGKGARGRGSTVHLEPAQTVVAEELGVPLCTQLALTSSACGEKQVDLAAKSINAVLSFMEEGDYKPRDSDEDTKRKRLKPLKKKDGDKEPSDIAAEEVPPENGREGGPSDIAREEVAPENVRESLLGCVRTCA